MGAVKELRPGLPRAATFTDQRPNGLLQLHVFLHFLLSNPPPPLENRKPGDALTSPRENSDPESFLWGKTRTPKTKT